MSLSLLGVKEGAGGLVDVGRARVTGNAHLIFAGDRSALTVDAESAPAGSRCVNRVSPRRRPRRRSRPSRPRRRERCGRPSGRRLRRHVGTAHLAASGVLEQKADHVGASFRFEMPSEPCQSLLDSVPTALLPALQGTKMTGTFGARGHFSFDTRNLDDLELEYDVQDQCRVTRCRPPSPGSGSSSRLLTASICPMAPPPNRRQALVRTTGRPRKHQPVPAGRRPHHGGRRLPHHRGFNRPAIRSSIVANLAARRFVRGASTITMQLAKNLFLARDKTLARKLQEVVLTDYLEQTFSKDELMELYLQRHRVRPRRVRRHGRGGVLLRPQPRGAEPRREPLPLLAPARPLRYGGMRDAGQVPDNWTAHRSAT